MGVSAVAALRIASASLLLLCSFMGSSLFCLMLTPGPAVRLQIRTLVLLLQNRQCKVQGSKSKVPSTQHPAPKRGWLKSILLRSNALQVGSGVRSQASEVQFGVILNPLIGDLQGLLVSFFDLSIG